MAAASTVAGVDCDAIERIHAHAFSPAMQTCMHPAMPPSGALAQPALLCILGLFIADAQLFQPELKAQPFKTSSVNRCASCCAEFDLLSNTRTG
jgi:hypothetical protein